MILSLLLFAALMAFLWVRLHTLLTYFQQEEYDSPRFLDALPRVRLYDLRATGALILGGLLLWLGLGQGLVTLLLALALLGIAAMERGYRFKKPLALTERARRIAYVALGLAGLLALAVFAHPLAALLAVQGAPFVLMIANSLLLPLQDNINRRYMDEARAKLARLDPIRIGITGSFGKTTVKHMFAEILEASAPTYYSRGSINTVLGHTRHIRERLQWSHRYLVAEMGAYGIGSIKRLCDFIGPRYGIVTAVGDAHTERFGSLENIAKAKSELVEAVCAAGGTAVINADVLQWAPFQALKAQYGARVISVGPDADVNIRSTQGPGGVWSIQLTSADARLPEIRYDIPLLGDHNVMNSALAVVMATVIDGGIAPQIPYFTKTLAQIPHRLQKRDTPGSALILDDAYNSNEQGFLSALEALDRLGQERGGRRILVTPGIAELGLEHDRVHARIGTRAAERCDVIYAVNPDRFRAFVTEARQGSAEVIEVASLAEARKAVGRDLREEDVVLYENDLPDLLEETRLL